MSIACIRIIVVLLETYEGATGRVFITINSVLTKCFVIISDLGS